MNAVEAMSTVDDLSRRLQISTSMIPDNNVTVTVRDSGPILKKECIERFFEAFYSTKASGMGIGLSICRSIVEAHDGRLWATRNPDGGASLHIALPTWSDNSSSTAGPGAAGTIRISGKFDGALNVAAGEDR